MKVMSDYLDSEKEETLDVRDLFDFFDSDKDGFISQQELQVLLLTSIFLCYLRTLTCACKVIGDWTY